jgi:hypothetical protein
VDGKEASHLRNPFSSSPSTKELKTGKSAESAPTSTSMSEKRKITVRYGIPGRQVFAMLGGVFFLVGAIMAMALTLKSPQVAAVLALAGTGGMIWWLIRSLNGEGELRMDDDVMEIRPVRRVFCTGSGHVRIAWRDVVSVKSGATNASTPRLFVMLKARHPNRSWIITPRHASDGDLAERMAEHVNAVGHDTNAPHMRVGDPYDTAGWRIAAGIGLVAFIAAVAGMLASGKLDDTRIWRVLLGLGTFAVPLSLVVFRSRR